MEKRGTKRPHEDTYNDNNDKSEDKNKAEVGVKVIYFDLETTGFNGQICSMAFLSSEEGSISSNSSFPNAHLIQGQQWQTKCLS